MKGKPDSYKRLDSIKSVRESLANVLDKEETRSLDVSGYEERQSGWLCCKKKKAGSDSKNASGKATRGNTSLLMKSRGSYVPITKRRFLNQNGSRTCTQSSNF